MDLNALLARVDAVKVGIRQVAIFVFVLAVAIGLTAVFVSLEFEFGWLGGAVGIGILLTLASRRYRRHLETVSGSWKAREEIGTAVGLLLVAYGASTLETASERSSTWLGTVGVALVLVGLVPVAFAIRKDVKGPGRLTPAATRTPLAESVKVWSANLLVAVLAVVPALTMVGVYWVIAFGVAIAWVLAEAASRSIAKERRRPWP